MNNLKETKLLQGQLKRLAAPPHRIVSRSRMNSPTPIRMFGLSQSHDLVAW